MTVHQKPACPFVGLDNLLRFQVQIYSPIELSFYYHSPAWMEAREVIDLGTGNGEFLKRVAEQFPDRQYLGIDSAPEFVELALNGLGGFSLADRVRFEFGDAHRVEGAWDFAITRFVLQYFTPEELRGFLSRLPRLLRDGGTLLIVDAIDDDIHFYPPVPEFHEFWDVFRASRRRDGFDRDIGPTFAKRLAALEADAPLEGVRLELERAERKLIPSTIPGHKRLFLDTDLEMISSVRQVFKLEHDIEPAKAALRRWYQHPSAYTQFGLSMASYRVYRR